MTMLPENMSKKLQDLFSETGLRKLVLAFFVLYFLVGLAVFRDYGVTTDEIYQVDKAVNTLDYVMGRNTNLLTYPDRHYGALYPILLQSSNLLFKDSRDNFQARHLINFSFFYLGVVFFYQLLRKLGFRRVLGLCGALLLVLHPQIFGHSFFNPKDIPFLTMWVIALYTLASSLQDPDSNNKLLIHGAISGVLVVFRLPGVMMWGISGLMLAWLWLSGRIGFVQVFKKFFAMMAVALLSLYAFLPVLWSNPLGEFVTFLSMSPFDWTGKELFMGQFYKLGDLPWFHLPVYILISMPLVVLALFGVGLVLAVVKLGFDRGFAKPENERFVFGLAAFGFSILVLLVTHPKVYNGWRHVLFLYPMIILIAIEAIDRLWQVDLKGRLPWLGNAFRGLLLSLVVGQMIVLAVFIAETHPYEYTYYNWLAGRSYSSVRLKYNMDYWGLSYLEAFEKILAKDPSARIVVSTENFINARQSWMVLSPEDRQRLVLVKLESPEPEDYFVTAFREFLPVERKSQKLVDSIYVGDGIISGTYKRKH